MKSCCTKLADNSRKSNTVEDGGLKEVWVAVLEFMSDNNYYPHVKRIGIPDLFIEHGSVQELHSLCEIDAPAICKVIIEMHNQEV